VASAADPIGRRDAEFLFIDPLVVAAGMNHRWANRRKIDFAE
jgi:hypothetical protein